jgi:hypothetical protein
MLSFLGFLSPVHGQSGVTAHNRKLQALLQSASSSLLPLACSSLSLPKSPARPSARPAHRRLSTSCTKSALPCSSFIGRCRRLPCRYWPKATARRYLLHLVDDSRRSLCSLLAGWSLASTSLDRLCPMSPPRQDATASNTQSFPPIFFLSLFLPPQSAAHILLSQFLSLSKPSTA